MLTAPFRPDHASNRMRDEGDVLKARSYYYGAASVKNVDALATPFEDARFDLPHPLQFFDEAARILRPGGRLLIRPMASQAPC